MLLTWPMFSCGLIAAALQWLAHVLMRNRTYHTPIARYGVGVAICLVAYTLAYVVDQRQEPITGIWYVFGCSGVATWLAYEADKKMPTDSDLLKYAPLIAAEHDETEHRDHSGE